MSQGIGQGLQWASSVVPQFLGGSTGAIGSGLSGWGSALNPGTGGGDFYPTTGYYGDTSGGTTFDNPALAPGAPATPALPPPAPTGADWYAGTPAAAPGSFSGGGSAPPFPTLAGPAGATGAATGPTGVFGTSSDPNMPPATDPYSGPFGALLKLLGGGGTAAPAAGTGAAGGGDSGWTKQIGPLLGLLGTGTTDILKFIQQRNLMNNLGGQATALNRKMNPALIRNITGPVKATLQETGNINSPYLTAQAMATAAAPYAFDQNMADLEAVLRQNALAFGMYPNFDLPGFTEPGIFGGGA